MKKHRIVLELGTAELDSILSAIESNFTSGASTFRMDAKRGIDLLDCSLADGGHDTPWSVLTLAGAYRKLVAHWERKNTDAATIWGHADQLRAYSMALRIAGHHSMKEEAS